MVNGNIFLLESPHISSYKNFLNKLGKNLGIWLTNICNESPYFKGPTKEITVTINRINDYISSNYDEENNCRLENKNLSKPLELTIEDDIRYSRNIKIGMLPCITDRGTFITKGTKRAQERCLIALLDDSPGIFLKEFIKNNVCTKEVVFMPKSGYRFRFRHKQKGPIIVVMPNGKTCSISMFFNILGLSKEDIEKSVFDTKYLDRYDISEDKKTKIVKEIKELFVKCGFTKTRKPTLSSIKNFANNLGISFEDCQADCTDQDLKERYMNKIREKMKNTVIGDLGRAQINRKTKLIADDNTNTSEFIDIKKDYSIAIKALIAYINDLKTADSRWDLGNLRANLAGEHFYTAYMRWCKWIERAIAAKAGDSGIKDIRTLIDLLENVNTVNNQISHFDRYITDCLIHSSMSQLIREDSGNPLEAVYLTRKITFNGGGWGGINIGHEREPRDIHWSHYGRLCPLDTPQSEDVGITLSLTVSARINELGIIEMPCYRVIHDENGISINKSEIVWLSSWEETEGNVWIAFPDQEFSLQNGIDVEAHNAWNTLKIIKPSMVNYIHVSSEGMYGITANLIPFRQHNHPIRGTMACSFLKQALPLQNKTAPNVKTGFEQAIPDAYSFSFWTLDNNEMAFGTDLLTGYMPWKGWNFEDALVISETAAHKLTDIQEHCITVKIKRSLKNHSKIFQSFRKSFSEGVFDNYDENGCLLVGNTVSEEDAIAIEIIKLKGRTKKYSVLAHKISEYTQSKAIRGRIISCENLNRGDNVPPHFRFTIKNIREAVLGDKLANRHGHKGVISKILDDCQMPFFLLLDTQVESVAQCPCGETRPHRHLEILINPLSIISRMNLGQLYETIEARDKYMRELPEKVECFIPDNNGGSTKIINRVLVGRQYIMKLDHNAGDKVHARSRKPEAYSSFVEQPLKGKRLEGGQRLGEMEVWSLMAHNSVNTLKELITIKSDDLRGRNTFYASLLSGNYTISFDYDFPEALKTFAAFCMGLGINITLKEKNRDVYYPFEHYKSYPEVIKGVQLSVMNTNDFVKHISYGEVLTAVTSGIRSGYRYHPEGLESEKIFGPVKSYSCACGKHIRSREAKEKSQKACSICGTPLSNSILRRWRFGHICLAAPIPNPFFMYFLIEELRSFIGLYKVSINALFKNNNLIMFKRIEDAESFFISALMGSSEFRKGFINIHKEIVLSKNTNKYEAKEIFKNYVAKVRIISDSLLKDISNDFKKIIKTEQISGIDLVTDMISVHKEISNLCITHLPVIPPKLRFRFQMPDGKTKPHDLTQLYKNVLRANELLKEVLQYKNSSEISEKNNYIYRRKLLYISVLQLMCNDKQSFAEKLRDYSISGYPVRHSLSTYLEGKEGLINGNLMGKRVDFSGRAVIIPDPSLHIDQCKLPPAIVLKLFNPLILSHINANDGCKPTVVDGKLKGDSAILQAINDILKNNYVLLNRQPTLHRLGMLSFKPLLGEGSVISISPLVTAGFNADFDGDQMAVFLPLTEDAKKEAEKLYPSKNKWHPANGGLSLSLAQDISLGNYLATGLSKKAIKEDIERKVKSETIVEDIIKLSIDAFAKVTYEGISFSIGELLKIHKEFQVEFEKGTEKDKSLSSAIKNNSPTLWATLESGAKGSIDNMMYLAGTIKENKNNSNLSMGLTIGEQIEEATEGRKNLVDTKLGTAEGGSLTKHLVFLAHSLWITTRDCGTLKGIEINSKKLNLNRDEILYLIYGKVLAANFGEYKRGYFIGYSDASILAQLLMDSGQSLFVRSPIYCKAKDGICQTCYGVFPPRGKNLDKWSTEDFPKEESRVGIIAAQAIGEPGTQMALRKKHTSRQDDTSISDIKKLFYHTTLSPLFLRSDFHNSECVEKVFNRLSELFPDIKGLKHSSVYRNESDTEKIINKLNRILGMLDFYDKYFDKIINKLFIEEDREINNLKVKTEQYRKQKSADNLKRGELFDIQLFNRRLLENYFSEYIKRFTLSDKIESNLLEVVRKYRYMGHSVSSVHFDVIFKGILDTFYKNGGWISPASHPDTLSDIDALHVIAASSFNNKVDNLKGLKECTFIGKRLPGIKENK